MKIKRMVLGLACVLPVAFGVRAERVVTLEECVDSALARNPAVGAAALEIERSRIMKGTAFNPPKTEITLKQETTGGGGPENGVYFGQEFDFPTLYVARHRSLTAQNELAAGRFDLLVADLEKEVSLAYYTLVYYNELLRINAELDSVYADFCRVAEIRLKEGESGALELMNARRVREKNGMERREIMAESDLQTAELMRLTGSSERLVPVETPFGPLAIVAAADTFDFNLTPRGVVAGREILVAEKEMSVARQELLPGIRIGATAQAVIKSFNPYHVERLPFEKGNFMGFEVGITVPLFFGAPSARIKATEAERRISELNREAAETEARSEVAKLGGQLASLGERLDYYRTTALPQADEIKRIARVSYELGDIDYIEYIANLETVYAVYREYTDCIHQYNMAALTLKNIVR